MLKKFKDMIKERNGFDDIDQPFDDTEFRGGTEPYKFLQDAEEEEEDGEIEEVEFEDVENENEEIENLLSTLRKIVKNSGFKRGFVFFDDEEECIVVQFVLNKTEKINNIMNVMNFLKKLESDILIQYTSEFDLWETKQGDPLVSVKFSYDEDVSTSGGDEDYTTEEDSDSKRNAVVDAETSYSNSSTKERLDKIGKYEFDDDPPF